MLNRLRSKFNLLIEFFNKKLIEQFGVKWKIILINEYPKCGATWLRNLLSETIGVNKNRGNWNKYKIMGFVGKNSIIQRHWKFKTNAYRTIIVLRDPRDVLNSFYFFENYYVDNNRTLSKIRGDINDSDTKNIEKYLPFKIEKPQESTPQFSYSKFWDFYKNDKSILFVKYEDMVADTYKELKRVLKFIGYSNIGEEKIKQIIDNNNIKKLRSKERTTDVKSRFFRKGIVGDWKNNFSEQSINYFKLEYGKLLEDMGYEKNQEW